jgi:hypothetical protein
VDFRTVGLTENEYKTILRELGRTPNETELRLFGVMWSEHCSYKSTRPLLRLFPTEGRAVVQGPGGNAGVVDLGEGFGLAFKVESHNHPSAVEPYQGAATGVGGIIRTFSPWARVPWHPWTASSSAIRSCGRPKHSGRASWRASAATATPWAFPPWGARRSTTRPTRKTLS